MGVDWLKRNPSCVNILLGDQSGHTGRGRRILHWIRVSSSVFVVPAPSLTIAGNSDTATSESQTDISSDEHCTWTAAGDWAIPDETVLSGFNYDELLGDMDYSDTGNYAPWETDGGTSHTLEDPEEAHLFRFFVDKIGVWVCALTTWYISVSTKCRLVGYYKL